jgi:hypothetical protein
MYFESIDDYKHLEMSCKRLQNNSEKFKYNPISISENEFDQVFPNIETQYIYSKEDKYIESEQIQRYVDLITRVSYQESLNKMKEMNKDIEYKNINFTKEDREIEMKQMKNNHFIIPNGVKEIGEGCFSNCSNLQEIIIPESVTKLGNGCFRNCKNLSKIEGIEHIKEFGENCFYNSLYQPPKP